MHTAATVRGVRISGVRAARLGGQRADLARGVRPLQGGQVDHRDGQVDRGAAWRAFLIDRVARPAARCSTPDRVDAGQAVQEAAQRRLVGWSTSAAGRDAAGPGRDLHALVCGGRDHSSDAILGVRPADLPACYPEYSGIPSRR